MITTTCSANGLKQLTEFVNQAWRCKTRSLWYVDTGPVLERDFAQRAGLGFVGKHTNLISRRLGNWIFLAEILTTLELEPDAPEQNHCGKCTRCITACPTNAITAPFQLDARKCISYLTIELKGAIPVELRPAIGNRIYGCDDCLAVCPWNRFAREGNLMKPHARPDLTAPDLIELLQLDETGFKSRFAGTPMLRTKRRGLLRNVCVALGNVGDATALPHLQKAARDPEPLIAEHARWAMAQIESRRKIILFRHIFQFLAGHGCRMRAHRGADGFHVIGGDFAGFVAPRAADVGEHGGEVGVGEIRAHWGHVEVPILALDLKQPVQAGLGNVDQARGTLGVDPFGTGQRRGLVGFAHAVHAVADAANGFIDFFALRRRRRRAGLGLIQFQLFGGDIRAVNFGIEPATVMVEINAAEEQQHEHQHENPHRNSRACRHRLAAGSCGTTGFDFVVHGLAIMGVNGASYSGTSAFRLNKYAVSCFASGVPLGRSGKRSDNFVDQPCASSGS